MLQRYCEKFHLHFWKLQRTDHCNSSAENAIARSIRLLNKLSELQSDRLLASRLTCIEIARDSNLNWAEHIWLWPRTTDGRVHRKHVTIVMYTAKILHYWKLLWYVETKQQQQQQQQQTVTTAKTTDDNTGLESDLRWAYTRLINKKIVYNNNYN